MIEVTLCVAYGSVENPEVWVGSYSADEERLPFLGMRTHVQLAPPEDDEEEYFGDSTVVAEVTFADFEDEEPVAYLYGGEELPGEELREKFEAALWMRLSTQDARYVLELVELAPPAAAIHEVLIVVGDVDVLDEAGNPAFQAWGSTLIPGDPTIPMFGDRIRMDIFTRASDDENEDDFDDEALEDNELEIEVIDLNEPASLERGFPALVVYSAKVEVGVAQLAVWVPSLGEVSGFDMIAAGWELMAPEELDFRLDERIKLAQRTRLDIGIDDEGDAILTDYEILDAAEVREDQYELLPPVLVEHCQTAREMSNLDSIVAKWVNEQG